MSDEEQKNLIEDVLRRHTDHQRSNENWIGKHAIKVLLGAIILCLVTGIKTVMQNTSSLGNVVEDVREMKEAINSKTALEQDIIYRIIKLEQSDFETGRRVEIVETDVRALTHK